MLTQIMYTLEKKKLLNVGCGDRHIRKLKPYFENWEEIRLDLYDESADIKCDIVTLKDVQDSTVDCVWASHVIEHLYWHELSETFNNFMRVLKPNGFAVITVPDLGSISELIKDNLTDPMIHGLAPIDFIFGSRELHERDGIGQLHKTGFTSKSMEQILNKLNIKAFIREYNYQIYAVCYKNEFDREILNHI